MEGIVSRPGDGEFLEGEERALRVKLSRDELDVLEFEVGPDYEGPGPHFHKQHVDSFYVLEGELEFTVGGNTIVAPAGTFVAAPPNVVHSFTNASGKPARFLNVHAPDLGFTELQRARLLNIHAPSTGFHGRLREMSQSARSTAKAGR